MLGYKNRSPVCLITLDLSEVVRYLREDAGRRRLEQVLPELSQHTLHDALALDEDIKG
jgi:hypothetical protein